MVRTDTGCDRQLQLRCLCDALGRQVGGPEGLRNNDIGVSEFAELEVPPNGTGSPDADGLWPGRCPGYLGN